MNDKLDDIQENLEEVKEEIKDEKQVLIEQLQRLQAEFENYRKRVEREQVEQKSQASEQLLKDILPIVDGLQLSLVHAKDEHGKIKGEDLLAGLLIIAEQSKHLLEHYGLTEIPTKGKFDPKLHEAITTEQGEKGMIIQTYQRGYMRNGKVFRHAKVSVAR